MIEPLPVGRGEIVAGDPQEADVGIAAIGSSVVEAVAAARLLAADGIEACVADARYAKPLDAELLARVAACPSGFVTVEENVRLGGFGSAVLEALQDRGQVPARMARLGLPDEFLPHGSPARLRAECGIDAAGIAAAVRRLVSVEPLRSVRDGRQKLKMEN